VITVQNWDAGRNACTCRPIHLHLSTTQATWNRALPLTWPAIVIAANSTSQKICYAFRLSVDVLQKQVRKNIQASSSSRLTSQRQ